MNLARYIFSFLMVAVVFAYSGGITIAKHYCKTEVVDLAINSVVEKCKGAKKSTPISSEPIFSERSCCSDEIASFKSFNFQLSEKILLDNIGDAGSPLLFEDEPLKGFKNGPVFISLKSPPLTPLPIFKVLERYLI